MKIGFKKTSGGYTSSLAKEFVSKELPIQWIGPEMETHYKWDDVTKSYTDEIKDYRGWFVQEGLPPFQVAFPKQVDAPEYLQIVEFKNLKAAKYRNNVYFRADDLKEVK